MSAINYEPYGGLFTCFDRSRSFKVKECPFLPLYAEEMGKQGNMIREASIDCSNVLSQDRQGDSQHALHEKSYVLRKPIKPHSLLGIFHTRNSLFLSTLLRPPNPCRHQRKT